MGRLVADEMFEGIQMVYTGLYGPLSVPVSG